MRDRTVRSRLSLSSYLGAPAIINCFHSQVRKDLLKFHPKITLINTNCGCVIRNDDKSVHVWGPTLRFRNAILMKSDCTTKLTVVELSGENRPINPYLFDDDLVLHYQKVLKFYI